MIATVDSFIRIFKFYQENALTQYFLDRGKGISGTPDGIYDRNIGEKIIDPKTGKYKRISLNEIFKINTLRYEDTIDVYLNSLVLDRYTQLSYDTDSETIQTAVAAREKLKNYFTYVLYPGSYAFNTADNASFRKLLLDWTSTIKTIQDSSKRLTDAYSLSSEDVDKALRGFGTSFINSVSLRSINRRKNFLLNVCDLYSIKGTPESIIKSLNILGLEDIFIREGWMFKDTDDGDIKIDWIPIKSKSKLNEITHQYEQLDTDNDFITDWEWFDKKINEDSIHFDPHWMYSKEEILKINEDKDVYMKLPSITPYFGIEFITDADKQIDAMETLFYEINKQFQKYLTNTEKEADYKLWLNGYDSKLTILQAYTGLVYSLIRLDDHLLYENFKSFLSSCEIQNLPDFNTKYEYFKLIYWFYLNYKLSDKEIRRTQYNCINSFIPIKSNDYCNYEQLLRWWLSTDYDIESEKEKIQPFYIYPDKIDDSPGFINLGWVAPFEYGRYGVQVFSKARISETCDGWLEIQSNNYSYQENMNVIASTDDADGFGSDVSCFRIVYYHTPSNLPRVFFEPPFNLDNQVQDTFLDRTVRYNGPSVTASYYNDNIIKNAFTNQHIIKNSTTYDVISGYHRNETMSTKIRVSDIDTTLKSIYSSHLKYPNLTRLYEDKWLNINNDFYNFVDWSIKDFTDTKKHEGLMYNNRNMIRSYEQVSVSEDIIGKTLAFDVIKDNDTVYRKDTIITKEVYNKLIQKEIEKVCVFTANNFRKYPVNNKWNWAVDTNYVYFCYESNKWCRIPCTIIDSNEVSFSGLALSYGDKFVINNSIYIYVSNNKVAKINCSRTWNVNDYDILPSCNVIDPETKTSYWEGGRIKEGSKLSRDLAVAQIKDSYILDLIYRDCIGGKYDETKSTLSKILLTEEIEVYKDPYNKNIGETYTYETFLTYLYNCRLILDFATGYIYPNYNTVLSNRSIFFKCFVNETSSDKVWTKVEPEFEWTDAKKSGIEAESIYNDWYTERSVDESTGNVTIKIDKSNSSNCGFLMPPYTLPNRYDSLRFLDGPAFTSKEELYEASEKDQIDPSVNYILVRGIDPVVYRRITTMNDTFTGSISKWEQCIDNHIYDCNYGIGVNLLEFIESRYAQDEQYYVTIVNDFTELINDYMTEILGIDGALLDLTIANWTSSGIVKKTITFYKPKRARLLFTSNNIEGDYGVGNNLDGLAIGDQDFNYYDLAQYRFGNPSFDKKNLNKMNRERISNVINEYVPNSDTIYALPEEHNQVYSSREIYDKDSKIPSLEVYDQLLNLNQQVNGNIIASFYVDGLQFYNANGTVSDNTINGFYYKIPNENMYSNNIYFFKEVTFMYSVTDENKKTRIVTEDRWAIFKTEDTVFNHSTCYYVANKKSKEPFRDISDKNDSTIKYALRDVKNHPKYIEDLDYSKGNFTSSGTVKTNKRILDPIFYISQFDNARCNGFYYQDEELHPNRNEKPVYFNQNGKIITFMKPDWVIPINNTNDIYALDDKWRMSSDNEIYNDKVLIESESTEIISGKIISGYGYFLNNKTIFFLYWNENIEKWIFVDKLNSINITLDNSDKKTVSYQFEINDSVVNIERYQKTNKFWVVADDKEILDFSECDYFAYAYLNDETIWNNRNNDITKVFHSNLNDQSKNNQTWGININALYDNEDLIDPQYGYIKTLNDKYSIYRRNHFNAIEMKNKPISYLYCYNKNIRNFYNDDNRIKIETNSTKYSMDKEGNPNGSIEVHKDSYLKYINEALNDNNEWSIAFRMLAFDQESINRLIGYGKDLIKPNEWFMVTLTSQIDYDYYFNISFDELKKLTYNNINEYLKNTKKSLVDQILELKLVATTIPYNFADGMCIKAYGGNSYYKENMIKHFANVTTYFEKTLRKYDSEKLILIRSSLLKELNNCISTLNQVKKDSTDIAVHQSLILTNIIPSTRVLNCDYYTFYINGKLVRNGLTSKNYFSGLTKEKLELRNVNVKISEYGLWEYAINEWYAGVISKFRILRARPEPSKSKTSNSKNNYRPIFVLDQPRIVYPLEHFALPENIKGGRFDRYNADPYNKDDKYVSEVNPLWRYDLPYEQNEKFFVKDGAECSYERHYVNDGKTLISESDYRIDSDDLPYWWIRKPHQYRSGPVYHKPLYIAIQEKVNECYPKIDHGFEDKSGNYHDIGIHFDGVNNKDTSLYNGNRIVVKTNKNKTYFDIRFDPNSSFTSEYDKYVLTDHNKRDIVGYAKDKPIPIPEDEEEVSIYTIARNFYPIDHGDRIENLKLRFVDIDNNGSKFDQNKIDNNSVIIPDIAQLTLTDDAMSNGIFHNDLKFYTTNSEYAFLCGTWIPSNEVKSWKDGDFNWCYKNNNNGSEAVLTYQRNSGYFWWEFRQKISGKWDTVARTYVHTRNNISKKLDWKDYVNWNQIDLVGQLICKFNKTDYDDFINKDWHLVNQEVIENVRRFTCGSWIKFELVEVTDPISIDPIISKNTYFDGTYLYFFDGVTNKWYRTAKKCETDWSDGIFDVKDLDCDEIELLGENNEEVELVDNVFMSDHKGILGKPKIPSGYMYRNGYLYYYVDIDNRWIRFEISNEISNDIRWSKHYQPWKFYKSRNTSFGYMNVINSSDSDICDCFDNCYVIPNNIDIIETYAKLVMFNGISDFDWSKHTNEDIKYPKSVNNDISICRCSLKDSVYVYVYQINIDNSRTLLDSFEASIIRTNKELVKPDQCWKRYEAGELITDPDIKGYRSMWNFFEFPLYRKYENNHVHDSIWKKYKF